MRILMAGMPDLQNQFGRSLMRYPGVEVEHTSSDPGRFPLDADAAVIIKCQISHQKFWDVKDAYKGKKVFVCSLGFTEIKEDFEKFLLSKGMALNSGTMAAAFAQAAKPAPEEAPPQTKEEGPVERKVHNHYSLEKIHQTIVECYEGGMRSTDIAKYLTAEGFRRASGEKYGPQQVSNMVFHLRQKGRLPMKDEDSGAIRPSAKPSPVGSAHIAVDQLALIGKVMGSALPSDKKLEMVMKIQKGEILQEETPVVSRVQTDMGPRLRIQVNSIYNSELKPLLTVDKFQVVALLKLFPELKRFADEA